ncbi:MAG: ribosomal RNA small subunit methyltransferase A [Zetaproteobacteria bacterium]|nr:ribosomal RNA small subunit methyltransferase A [Zetaproteobacteria bacterium]
MNQPKAKKALGQHFLTSTEAVRRIIEPIEATASVIEIGPGPGALTHDLVRHCQALTLIEKDDRFVAQWQQQMASFAGLSVVHGDVLKCLQATVAATHPQWIVGNLPYNISGPLTAQLAGLDLPGGMVLMYQREVGERIMAESGSKVYGGLSVLARHHYRMKRLMLLPPGAFNPPPKVHSVIVQFIPHGEAPACRYDHLQQTVRLGFAHRRKVIANNVKGWLDAAALEAAAIDPRQRPEQLDYAAWVRLTLALEAGSFFASDAGS